MHGVILFVSCFMLSAAPTVPRRLSVTRHLNNNTGIEVNWLPPRDSNGNVSYIIQYSTDDQFPETATVELTHSGEVLYESITGLEQGVQYYVRVLAVTEAGTTAGQALEHMFAGVCYMG